MPTKLREIIDSSDLATDKKDIWAEIFESIGDEHQDAFQEVLRYVEAHPDRLDAITDNILKKRDALMTGDTAALDKIIEEEVALAD